MDDESESNAPTADREVNNDDASSLNSLNNGVAQPRTEETNRSETIDAAVRADQLERQKSLVGRSASNTTTGDATLPESARDSVGGSSQASTPTKHSSRPGKRSSSKYRGYMKYLKYAGIDNSGSAPVASQKFTIEGAQSNFDYGPTVDRGVKQGAVQPRASQNEQTPAASANVAVAGSPKVSRSYQYSRDYLSKILRKCDLAPVPFQQLSTFDAGTGIPAKIARGFWLTEDEFDKLQQFQEVLSQSHERARLENADVLARIIWVRAPQLTALEVWIVSRYLRNLQPLLCCIYDLQMLPPESEMVNVNWLSALTGEWLVATFQGETKCPFKTGYLERLIRHTSPTFYYLISEFVARNTMLAKILAGSDFPPKTLARADVRTIGQLLCRITRYLQMADSLPPVRFPSRPDLKHLGRPDIMLDDPRVLELNFATTAVSIDPETCPCDSDSSHESVEQLPPFEDAPRPDLDREFSLPAIEEGDENGGDSRALVENPPVNSDDEYKQAVHHAIQRVGAVISAAQTKLFWDAVEQEMKVTTVEIERLPKELLEQSDNGIDLRKFLPKECDASQQVESSLEGNVRPMRIAKTKANAFIKQIAGCGPGPLSEPDASAKEQERFGSPVLEDPTMDPADAYMVFQRNRGLLTELLNQPGSVDGTAPKLSDPVPEVVLRQKATRSRVPIGKVGTFPSFQASKRPEIPLIMLDDFWNMRTPSPAFSMTGCEDMPDLSDILGVADSATGKEGSSDDPLNSRHRPRERHDGAGPSHEDR